MLFSSRAWSIKIDVILTRNYTSTPNQVMRSTPRPIQWKPISNVKTTLFGCELLVFTLWNRKRNLLPLPNSSIFTEQWPFEHIQTLCLCICNGMQCGCGARALKRAWKQDITASKYFWYVRQMDKLLGVHMSACTSLSSFSLLSFFHSCPLKPPPFRDWWIIDSV